jgi:hypothetical protein
LGVEPGNSFLIPIEVAPSGSTGVAIGNTSGSPLIVNVRLFGENGTQTAISTDARIRPLAGHGQVADFVTNLFPQVAGTTFRGTLRVDAPSGAAANILAATALTVKEGLLSALPVLSGTAAGASTLEFPQVAFGGGYSTTVTILASGGAPASGELHFYSQSGAERTDLATTFTLSAGGSARYTLPNTGPLTVVWGEIRANFGTVQGVATFDLRSASGALTTSAGVHGTRPGTGFTLPVDLTTTGSTGIAIANTQDTNLAVSLRLVGENATLVATATDARFITLAARAQVADFVTAVFPQLTGTTFKGALIVEGASLAATALTIKEGLLSALPVITGTITVSAGGGTGGGGTGGGGGIVGSGPASDCFSAAPLVQ